MFHPAVFVTPPSRRRADKISAVLKCQESGVKNSPDNNWSIMQSLFDK
jgi:hypothetical protein